METPQVGDWVKIRSVALCPDEGSAHGYHPYVKGLEGVIVRRLDHVPPPRSHPWRVVFLNPPVELRPGWAYFKATELDLML